MLPGGWSAAPRWLPPTLAALMRCPGNSSEARIP